MGDFRILAAMVMSLSVAEVGCDQRSSDPAIKRDVYLLLIDTLRADHLGLYGYERPTSPNLDHFAESAIVFEKVVAAAPWTLPSVGSVMTGVYPSAHGLRARGNLKSMTALRPGVTTLAEVFASNGYRTVAIVTNPWLLAGQHGLSRGFEETIPLSMKNAPAVNQAAREVIARDDPRPLFLYLHYMDPHGPYNRHSDVRAAGLGPLPKALNRVLTSKEKAAIPPYLLLPGEPGLGTYIRGYDRAIRAWDQAFGRWIAWLEARKSEAAPLIAVVADHGEEFAERGSWSHGETLYEEQLWVPWLLRLPDRSPGRVTDRVVSHVDFAPTLLAALGLPIPETMVGIDALGADLEPQRSVFAETDIRIGGIVDSRFVQRAVRRGDIKHIHRPTGPECYDLARDRSERTSTCTSARSQNWAALELAHWKSENEELARAMGVAATVELDAEQRERLRAIGYAQ